jgi:hypothetical protein
MQNNYKGPPEAFALVIPVPTVLQREDVKTLPQGGLRARRSDGRAAPGRVLGEDPCAPEPTDDAMPMASGAGRAERRRAEARRTGPGRDDRGAVHGRRVPDRDPVGEGRDGPRHGWLRRRSTRSRRGRSRFLRPYVEEGMKFFVAKVDPTKVKFDDGGRRCRRCGSTTTARVQPADPAGAGELERDAGSDRVILAPGQRYEVANYGNVTIPTNLDVKDAVKDKFGEFYAALFDRTIEKNPGAVVTEYAWHATNCDPCPGPVIADGCRRSGSTCWAATWPRPFERRHGVRLDPAPRALRQDRHEGGPGLQGGGADRRRARVRGRGQRQARGAVAARLDQQLPGALRDPPRVDRADHLREADPRPLGRAAERPARSPRAARCPAQPGASKTSPSSAWSPGSRCRARSARRRTRAAPARRRAARPVGWPTPAARARSWRGAGVRRRPAASALRSNEWLDQRRRAQDRPLGLTEGA